MNLSGGGNGPHHSLRDMELDYRLGRAGVRPEEVRAVVYSFIDDHAKRVVDSTNINAPRYVVENGRAVYKGTFADAGELGRFRMLLQRSRVYPALRNKFLSKSGGADWELLYAVVGEMNRICRERHGFPLAVVSWSALPETRRRFLDLGVDLVEVSDAFGPDWPGLAIKYLLFDGHPSSYGNKRLARRLRDVLAADGRFREGAAEPPGAAGSVLEDDR